MLDLEQLLQRCAGGESFNYLYFWGHTPPADGSINKSCLSQWFDAGFEIDGITYQTAEHWMMACKARLFGDKDSLEKIIATKDPMQAKLLGREVKNFDAKTWMAEARQFVTVGNIAKFSQNAELGAFLMGTGNTILVEASPQDTVWGIGLVATDPKAKHPTTWQGTNLLGFALMDAREDIQFG